MKLKTSLLFLLGFCGTSFTKDALLPEMCSSSSYSMSKIRLSPTDTRDGRCLDSTNQITSPIPVPSWCCPDETTCENTLGGKCFLKWIYEMGFLRCDIFFTEHCKSNHCGCCIACHANVCSPCFHDPAATCKRTCSIYEYAVTDETPCHSPFCQCCKRCVPEPECSQSGGYCVSHPNFCTRKGYYPTARGCSGKCCYCCRPALPNDGIKG